MSKQNKNKLEKQRIKQQENKFSKGLSMPIQMGLLLFVVLLTWFVYSPSLKNNFVNWDDEMYVTKNMLIHHPELTSKMITTPVGGNYHPLTMYSLAIDYKRSENLSEKEQAYVFHMTSLIFHLMNTVLVFFFLMALSRRRFWMSIVCALLFALHPMHVESVAWISERKDVLYTFFFLISLICYIRFLKEKKYLYLIGCFISFVLSSAAKPAAVVLPLVLFAIDYFMNEKINVKKILEKVPFFVIAVFVGIITIQAQKEGGAIADIEQFSWFQKFFFATYGSMMYVIKLIAPVNLCNLYPFPNIEGQAMGLEYYLSPIFLIAIALLIYFARKNKVIVFGFAFFFINILLVLQIVSVGQAIISERYTYVPYLGLFMILAWWLDEKEKKIIFYGIPLKPLLIFFFVTLIIISIIQTADRIKVWKNSETLWTDAIEKFPHRLAYAYNNRAIYYRQSGNYGKALADYNEAIKLNPKKHLGWANKANIFFDLGKNDSAIVYYNKALELKPDLWETLANRGAAKGKMGNYDSSVADLKLSLSNDPENFAAWENLAVTYTLINKHEDAIICYRKVLEMKPRNDVVFNAIGVSLQNLNKYNESITEFNKAIELNPSQGMYVLNRSYSWNALGNPINAKEDAAKAKNLNYNVPEMYLRHLNLK